MIGVFLPPTAEKKPTT